jgi:argininosuccinate lyase
MKLWGGRFASRPSEVFERFGKSLHFDCRLAEVDIQGSIAFAHALERVGILTASERAEIVAAFEDVRREVLSPGAFADAPDEDVHTFIIRKLGERTRLAGKIHTGRSRNEQVSLDTRLWLRGAIDAVRQQLLAVMSELLQLARRYPDAVIPGYTHLRRAQAVLWPHYCLAYFEMFARDLERLDQTRARVNVLPLGSGALAGSAFPFDRDAIAGELGFAATTRNSMDVSADRDWALDFLHTANLTMLHLSRLAEDWILYSSEEFGWMELSDQVTSGSSLMPQKKNPDSLELIRGKSGRTAGDYVALLTTMKGLPLTYNRDMQEDKQPLFDAADQVLSSLEMARVVIATAELHPEAPRAAAAASWLVATDIAEELARQGTPFHEAHQLAGRLVLESIQAGKRPQDWTAEALRQFSPRFGPDFVRLMDPAEGMKTREIKGGTGPSAVSAALAEAQARLDAWAA